MAVFIVQDEIQDDLSQLLLEISKRLQPFGSEPPVYGANAALDSDGIIFRMQKYCWCEAMDCPWCGGELITQNGYSNHEILRLEPIFEASGRIDGEGAPNFWFDDGEASIKIWWYKYIGRGFLSDRLMTAPDIAHLRKAVLAALADRDTEVLRNAVRSELSYTDLGDSSSLLPVLQDAFLALIQSAPKADQENKISEVSVAIQELQRQSNMAHQAQLAGEALDKAGIARSANPEDPEDLQFELTLTTRLEHLVDGNERLGSDTPS